MEKDEPELADGFSALFDIVLETGGSLEDEEVSILREALAEEIFGAAEAAVLIDALESTDMDARRRLTHADSVNRSVSLMVRAETPEHASYLTKTLQASINSGALRSMLQESGLADLRAVEMGNSLIVGSLAPPQSYPTTLSRASDSNALVIEVILDNSGHSWIEIATFASSLVALLLAVVAVVCAVLRRRQSCTVQPLSDPSDAHDVKPVQGIPDFCPDVPGVKIDVKVIKIGGKMHSEKSKESAVWTLPLAAASKGDPDSESGIIAACLPGQVAAK
eukprot:CAMPEP_0117683234 /NCGR_PEP_ID=MMETSP0804-20121206/20249_1 /TAXON_ID=1074897 /ORGANISM="Tetraselmis astigmatica, Strain CCMP880" /LENGTH=277 /DNA_ID=CAMNT_0005493729 /DNA_START=21 /DNA_END=854 /DNA_ORIENTATION=-